MIIQPAVNFPGVGSANKMKLQVLSHELGADKVPLNARFFDGEKEIFNLTAEISSVEFFVDELQEIEEKVFHLLKLNANE